MRHALLICLSLCLLSLTGCPEDGTTEEAGAGGDSGAGGTGGDTETGGTGGDTETGGTGGTETGGTGGTETGGTGGTETGGTGGTETGGTGGDMATGGTGGMGSSTGSCCEAHAEGGCVDGAIEACVCGLNPDCCTAWDASCVLIVQQKFCEPEVRECVCGTGEGQWAQTQCCEASWSDLCSSTALIKCMGDPSCT